VVGHQALSTCGAVEVGAGIRSPGNWSQSEAGGFRRVCAPNEYGRGWGGFYGGWPGLWRLGGLAAGEDPTAGGVVRRWLGNRDHNVKSPGDLCRGFTRTRGALLRVGDHASAVSAAHKH
jgi:hypothetical protein